MTLCYTAKIFTTQKYSIALYLQGALSQLSVFLINRKETFQLTHLIIKNWLYFSKKMMLQ